MLFFQNIWFLEYLCLLIDFNELTLEFNYQEYDGEDYTQRRKERIKRLNEEKYKLVAAMNAEMNGKSARFFKMGQMGKERKNYNEDAYYRQKLDEARNINAANKNMKKDNKNGLKEPDRLPDIRYWQLYDVENLYLLHNNEWNFFVKYKNAHYYNPEKHVALTEDEIKTKEKILADGFDCISYRNFACFVRSVIKYGKDDIDSICSAMIENGIDSDDSEEEIIKMIKRYHTAFFEKGPEIEELEASMERIEDGEERRRLRLEREKERDLRQQEKMKKRELWDQKKREYAEKKEQRRKEIAERQAQREREAAAKRAEKERRLNARLEEQAERMKSVLNLRITKWKDSIKANGGIHKSIQIPDAKGLENGFDKELDTILFTTTHEMGYGNWKEIRSKLVNHPFLQFNFFLLTLTESQLKNRMDTILRACAASKSSKKRSIPPSSSSGTPLAEIKGMNDKQNNSQPPPLKKRKMDIDS